MRFEVNGEERSVESGSLTVLQLLVDEGLVKASCCEPRVGIAVAINESIIPRSRWDKVVIQPDDNVDLFQAIAGG